MRKLTVLELCAGAGGQALGFERAGYKHVGLLEIDKDARQTLRLNRPKWKIIEDECGGDIKRFTGAGFEGTDVIAAGLPCPPWSKAGKQLGQADERDLFPAALMVIEKVQPKAILIENVSGILDPKFAEFRESFASRIRDLGYHPFEWQRFRASDFGVPQLRPRAAFIAVPCGWTDFFYWPPGGANPPTVGEKLLHLMAERGWEGAKEWSKRANSIGPTLVGGSKKHGGPDLGPTRAKREWAKLGINAHLVAREAPEPGFVGDPCLTVKMAALLQGFGEEWQFFGAKTSSYRQVGNAFPPPVAEALARAIAVCIREGLRLNPNGGTLIKNSQLLNRPEREEAHGSSDEKSSLRKHAPS
jgi:DNA (cytosine-5)-methyltransferase 1